MIEFDFSKIRFVGKLPDEVQKAIEKRALAVDDNDDPPLVLDKDGKYIQLDTDTLRITYRILYALEHKKKGQYMAALISPEAMGADPDKWLEVIRTLYDEGLITGIEVTPSLNGGSSVDIEHARITLKGVEYLQGNSAMAKIGRAISSIVSIR